MTNFISVILPTYNRATTLRRSLESVLKQTHKNLELIVVDDGSSDDTANLVKKYQANDFRIHYHYIENSGVSAARNFGIKKAAAKWLAFIDSDDEWLPQKLEKQLQYVQQHPEIQVIHTNEIWIRDGVRVNPHNKHQKFGGRIFEKCLPICAMSPSTIMIHQDVLEDVGLFNEDYPVCEDYDLWLRITCKYEVAYLKEFLIRKYGGHEDQLSRKYKAMDYWRLKSMRPFFNDENLSRKEQEQLKTIYQKKYDVLHAGSIKHDNQDLLEKLTELAP